MKRNTINPLSSINISLVPEDGQYMEMSKFNLLEDHKIKLLFMYVNETISQQLAVPEIIPFEWHSSKEDSEENRNRYIKYLNDTILCADLEYPMTVFDPTQQSELLDAEFNENFAVTGTVFRGYPNDRNSFASNLKQLPFDLNHCIILFIPIETNLARYLNHAKLRKFPETWS